MGAATKFLILYLIPVISLGVNFITYLFVYGESVDHPLIDFALVLLMSGFLISSSLSIKLIFQFLDGGINLLGITFSVVGWLVGLIPISLYVVFLIQ